MAARCPPPAAAAAAEREAGPVPWRLHPGTLRPVADRRPRAARPAGADPRRLRPAQRRELYAFVYATRRLEEHLEALQRQGLCPGSVYRSLGQEGTAVGCAYGLAEGDTVQPLIRDLGAMLVHGVQPRALLRQYLARQSGPTAGRDQNMHFSCPKRGILGPVSMLGAGIAPLAGILLAARLLGRPPRVGLAFIGDGGSSTGAFYEGLNFAAVQRLPLLLVLQANGYAFSTPTALQLPAGDLLRRARGFGAPVWEVDGNDAVACALVTAAARDAALRPATDPRGGVQIVLAHTYRRSGHASHDASAYVPADEAPAWATHDDPLARLEAALAAPAVLGAAACAAARAEVDAALARDRDAALAEAAAAVPPGADVADGVFADGAPGPWPPPDSWLGAGAQHRGAPRAAAP